MQGIKNYIVLMGSVFSFAVTCAQLPIEYEFDRAVVEAVERNVHTLDSLFGQKDILVYYMYITDEADESYRLLVGAFPEDRVPPQLRTLLSRTNRVFRTHSRLLPVLVECDNLYYLRENWRIPAGGLYVELDYKGNVLGSGASF